MEEGIVRFVLWLERRWFGDFWRRCPECKPSWLGPGAGKRWRIVLVLRALFGYEVAWSAATAPKDHAPSQRP